MKPLHIVFLVVGVAVIAGLIGAKLGHEKGKKYVKEADDKKELETEGE